MGAPEDEHQCEWRDQYGELKGKHEALATGFSTLKHEFEMMKRHLLGPKSEKMPRVKDELLKAEANDEAALAKRRADAAATRKERANARKAALATKTTVHARDPAPDERFKVPVLFETVPFRSASTTAIS